MKIITVPLTENEAIVLGAACGAMANFLEKSNNPIAKADMITLRAIKVKLNTYLKLGVKN